MGSKELKAVDPTTFERVPPHNLEAEQSLLGAMLLSPDATAAVIEQVRPEYFYREAHRHVYEAIAKLFMSGEPSDPIMISEELEKAGVLEKVGGKPYIHTLVNFVPTAANAKYYAEILQRHSLLRSLIRAATDIAAIGYEAPENLEAAIDRAESLIFNVSQARVSEKFSALEALLTENWELMDKLARNHSDITGLAAGFRDLDHLTSGFQPSDLIIVAARPAMGKTSFALDIARNVAVDGGKAVALFSLEMSKLQLAQRLLSSEAMVPSQKLRSPARLTDRENQALVAGTGRLAKAKIFVDDTASITIMEIRAKARRLMSRENLGLIIVDYLQLIQGGSRSESRQQEISEISRSLKILGREFNIPVIAVSQLSRAVENRTEDRRPRLADLRECVTGETLVVMGDGRRVPIRDLVGRKPQVLSVSSEGNIVRAESDKVWLVGRRPVYKIHLSSGRTIRATAEHRLFGANGWVKVRDLVGGDRLAVDGHIPEPFSSVACSQMAAKGVSHRAMQAARGVAYGGSAHFRFAPSRSMVLEYAELLDSNELRVRAQSALFWDTVVDVRPDGEEDVYDLTVPGPASWLADGIVSHNSGAIEQDADLVIFIYRDERYNPDSEDKGMAEIIIGKHRNGPTGTIKLKFFEEFAKFEDLEQRHRDG